MLTSHPKNKTKNTSFISHGEEADIELKIEYEISRLHHNALKIGSLTNIVAGLFVFVTLYKHVNPFALVAWYLVLFFISILDILWAARYDFKQVSQIQVRTWRRGFYLIFSLVCLTWGSLCVFFMPADVHYQFYILAFVLATLIGFTFTTIIDFTIGSLSTICLLLPAVLFRVWLGVKAYYTTGTDPDLNLGISAGLLILGIFLVVVCYIGARIVNRFFRLSFENIALTAKLENMNKFLEQRVEERTVELEKSLKLVTYQATHDLLTDLPNQRLLLEYVQTAVNSAGQGQHMFAVVLFSLNEIEKINDGLGYQAGDSVIQNVAQRLRQLYGKDAKNQDVSRYSLSISRKDVFAVVLQPIYRVEELDKIEELFRVLDEPVYAGKQPVKLTASIGVSLYPRDGRDVKTLFMNADAAMLKAKQQGGNNISVFHAEKQVDMSKQLEIERNLHNALKNDEFILQYQPIIELATGRICGMESLVRWKSPTLGFVTPDNFIPLAEANGIIIPLGEWVLRTACVQTKRWHDQGHKLTVAVNLSAKQLQKQGIAKTISDIILESGLPPECLALELTETVAFREDVLNIIREFKEMGVKLSIDDFGTGYSGLSNLKLFSIDTLKIDKSFIRDVDANNDSKAIVSNTIALAKKINVSIVAEGVETKEQLRFLKDHGCDKIQGYYFSPPVNPDAFAKLLENKAHYMI